MKRLLLLTTCLLAAAPVFAGQGGMQSPAYAECSALATSNPPQALIKAEAWLKIDTGIAAQHCRAMALYGLRRFAEAGDALTAVREMAASNNIPLRSYVARQAARAYMGANRADQALTLLDTQIAEITGFRGDNAMAAKATAELLLERAHLNISYGKLEEATKDLDHAISLTPTNEELLLERASVFEKLGDIPLARNDLASVLTINSNNSAARAKLERLNGGRPPAPSADASPAPEATSYAPAAPVMGVSSSANSEESQQASPVSKPKRSSKRK